jgi:uncharacterized protein (TIGR02246 family)
MLTRKWIVSVLICACSMVAFGQEQKGDEPGVRDLIGRWNAAYRALDAKKLAAVQTPDFEIVNRLGQWTPLFSTEQSEKMWAWAFTNIYKGKAGPEHTIERVRFLTPDVSVVQARAYWKDIIVLDDGTQIPPHGEIDTFVAVRNGGVWRVASLNIHNQMPPFDIKPGEPLAVPYPPK